MLAGVGTADAQVPVYTPPPVAPNTSLSNVRYDYRWEIYGGIAYSEGVHTLSVKKDDASPAIVPSLAVIVNVLPKKSSCRLKLPHAIDRGPRSSGSTERRTSYFRSLRTW